MQTAKLSGYRVWAVTLTLFFGFLLSGGQARAQSGESCSRSATSEPVNAGVTKVVISAPCEKLKTVRLRYDTLELVRQLDDKGKLELNFDCFLGDKVPLIVTFADGEVTALVLQTVDLDRVTKIAVIWKGGINLDLHAFEYGVSPTSPASPDDPSHIWAGNASSRWQVEEAMHKDQRGHGFISFASDGGAAGDQLEVYTFVHEPTQTTGAVKLALDYESRARLPQDPDTCGTGLYAEIEYGVIVRHPQGRVTRSRGSFAPLECNKIPDLLARYNAKAIPQVIVFR